MKDSNRPLRAPADLRHHVLLQYDHPDGRHPWMHWKTWVEIERLADLRPAGGLSFSSYDAIAAKNSPGRPEVADFVNWLREESKKAPR